MVYYRTYRPQTFHDLDSSSVREKIIATLKKGLAHNTKNSDIDSDTIPHAFLFTGPKGLGKTSTARLIAKAVNCEWNAFALTTEDKTKELEPCNTCAQCISITNGSNLDVMEFDAASHRGIDEIRALKENINLRAVQARKKIYIIDEVHMLTTEAFNALLKTLEEPPAHALFMLCTTEQEKVPVTIVSRCFHISFSPATPAELVRSLQRIVRGENIRITSDALDLIAHYSDGGFRDAAKLLEEAVALSDEKEITADLIQTKLHIGDLDTFVDNFLTLLQLNESAKLLDFIEDLVKEKKDLQYFIQAVLERLHNLFLDEFHIHSKNVDKHAQVKLQKAFRLEEIQQLVTLFGQAYLEMKQAYMPQLPLEIAVVYWIEQHVQQKNETRNAAEATIIKEEENVSSPSEENKNGITVSHLRKQVGAMAKIKALYGDEKPTASDNTVETIQTTSVRLLDFTKDGEITPQWLDAFWRSIVTEMKKQNHTAAGVLRSCRIKTFDRENLIIEAAYQFHKERLQEAKIFTILEHICKELLGKQVTVQIVLRK